jgi:uncharacterized membrane protein
LSFDPRRAGLHPLHAILLSFPIAMFCAALASDIAYLNTGEIQWSNLSQWAITAALVFGAAVVVWAIVDTVRGPGRGSPRTGIIYLILVVAMWVLGLINAFKHSQDAWSSVGTAGVLLSLACAVLALAAGWVGHSRRNMGANA